MFSEKSRKTKKTQNAEDPTKNKKKLKRIQNISRFQEISDYFILDTSTTAVQGVGASGNVHDWNISKAIVDSVSIPVVLAGGLSPENIQEAISIVNPWGVDSLTHTNKLLNDGSFIKDIEKVREFYINATAK